MLTIYQYSPCRINTKKLIREVSTTFRTHTSRRQHRQQSRNQKPTRKSTASTAIKKKRMDHCNLATTHRISAPTFERTINVKLDSDHLRLFCLVPAGGGGRLYLEGRGKDRKRGRGRQDAKEEDGLFIIVFRGTNPGVAQPRQGG